MRRAVAGYASEHSVADPPMSDLKLAVSEALTNSVVHGFPAGEPGTMTVLVTVDDEASLLTVVVTDDGSGLKPRTGSPGLGLGLPLIATVAATADFSTAPGGQGTCVRMTFPLGEAV